jgi:glycosyltransferase involved in cell wall biosynthesis
MIRPRVVCLNNIPTPYRLFFFSQLGAELHRRDWGFEAWFMANSEPGRYWTFQSEDFNFDHKFLSGWSPRFSGASFHINPGILRQIAFKPPQVLISAGAWGMPTTIFSSLAGKKTRKVFWSESHFLSIGRSDTATNWLRSRLLNRYDAFAVPGRLAKEYVEYFAPGKRIIRLPNLVDAQIFGPGVERLRETRDDIRRRFALPRDRKVLLITARLHPAKGILPFLQALTSLPIPVLEQFLVVIAGDGLLRQELETWISEHKLPSVLLLGHQTQQSLYELYAIANGIALPSYSDPNPLAVIEALWAKLPLLLSDRVGNHHETLVRGLNGWLFSIDDPSSVCNSVKSWALMSIDQLATYGLASSQIASNIFDPETVIKQFVDELLTIN